MLSNPEIVHKLMLAPRLKIAELKLVKKLNVCDKVLFAGMEVEIISIYNESSPLCGYVLVSGVGRPVKASELSNLKTKQ